MKKHIIAFFTLQMLLAFGILTAQTSVGSENYLNFKNTKSMQSYFAYKADGSILVSGHRGGREVGFPENSIEGLENAVSKMPVVFEIDPRLTKDSVIVLLHDATLDRTTDAKGRLSDYTWAELQSVRLKDSEGNVTDCKIPRLDDVIDWSRGKTIINLDKKDVPLPMIVDIIKKHKAKHVMLTVHTGAQARYYYDRLPNAMMSVFSRNDKEYEDISISGVPWENMIAYVGWTIDEKNQHIVKKLRNHGVRCMVSFAPSHDKLATEEERAVEYKKEVDKQPDIIESDIPTEIWNIIK